MSRRGYGLAIAALAALVLGGAAAALWGLPAIGDAIEDAPDTLGEGTYAFGAGMALLEFSSLVGVVVPFEVGVVLSGAVAGEGEIEFVPLALAVFAAAAIGDSLNFATGRRFGRPFIEHRGPRFGVSAGRLARIDDHFERHGTATVFVGRFIPFVRSSAPFCAGSSIMPYARFAAVSVPGCALWAVVFGGIGYVFYRSADRAAELVDSVGLIAFVVLVLLAGALFYRSRRGRGGKQGSDRVG